MYILIITWLLTSSTVYADFDDDLIEYIVNGHDGIRRKLALGTALNNNGTLPPAKNMYGMVFSGNIETEAQRLAQKCSSRVRGTTGAQNIRFFKDENLTLLNDKELVDIALSDWYAPVQIFGLHNENNTYNDLRLESFANLIYYKNNDFGCALKRCNTTSKRTPLVAVLICLYANPPILGQPLYETGTACSDDNDCTVLPYSLCADGICITHVLFPRPEPNEICPQNVNMTDTIREKFHNTHNKFRAKLARGFIQNEPRPSPTSLLEERILERDVPIESDDLKDLEEASTTSEQPDQQNASNIQEDRLPTAGDMYYMMYDCDLEAEAQQHASECSLKMSNSFSREDVGENVHVFSGSSRSLQNAAEKAVNAWWNEMPNERFNKEMIFTEEMSYDKTNSSLRFTQMVWAKSYRLGCGIQNCAGKLFVVCRYAERGNIVGNHIYRAGSPCEFCSESCAPKVGLCRPPT
ncbi:hypothetical protein RB195_015965 [Necator americanus]|uniref:SCP domain-containing protein n=1 Tax=Necator americanus TaxID=51031 RepID=A0ABR1E7K9_NECAM